MFRKSPEKKFLQAAATGDVAAMAALLERGVDINTRNGNGETALRIAALNNDVPTTRLLLDKGADPNMADNAGRTPLSRAAGEGFNVLLKLLLAAPGIDVDAQKIDGDTALRLAVVHNHLESTRLLLEAGANPNIQNSEGNTPLIRAVAQGYTEITKILLEHGANPHIRNNALWTAADFAKERRQHVTLQMVQDFIAQQEQAASLPAPAALEAMIAPVEDTDAPAALKKPASAAWHVTDDQEVARVATKEALGKEITEIFNFRAERVITIIKDLKQNSETTLEKNFTEVQNPAWLEEAAKVYEAQTGEAALFQGNILQKPKPALKPNKG
ncbi:MAG TPA: ankyrin repeat domain-containing protein [Alphaproteobacteria bacterium]|jgi:hypothetical protein|nr:ankyrin repeat domain-containing protein [Alphaproteobacteria bacterium]